MGIPKRVKPIVSEIDNSVETEKVNNIFTSNTGNLELDKLRQTERWKFLYKHNLQSMSAMRGGKKAIEEAYLKMIDKMAKQPPVNQKNIMSGFKPFASPNFKYKSEEDDS